MIRIGCIVHVFNNNLNTIKSVVFFDYRFLLENNLHVNPGKFCLINKYCQSEIIKYLFPVIYYLT